MHRYLEDTISAQNLLTIKGKVVLAIQSVVQGPGKLTAQGRLLEMQGIRPNTVILIDNLNFKRFIGDLQA